MSTRHVWNVKKEIAMRRYLPFVSLVALVCLLAMGSGHAAAQPATPHAGTELAPGVFAEVFAGVPADRAPGQTLYLARFTFLPGSAIFPHGHPGTTVLSVDQGSFGWTLVKGTAHVVRGAAAGATGPSEDLTAPGTDVVLEPGDAIYYESDVVHTARGAGDEPAVVSATLLLTAGQPLLMTPAQMAAMGSAATPTP
jgi:quercetin dioxygenase-like cupin family protein